MLLSRIAGIATWKLLAAALAVTTAIGAGDTAYALRHREPPLAVAERLVAEGRMREALLHLRAAARDNPRDSRVMMLMATANAQTGDPEAAERDVKRARSLGADGQAVLLQLGHYYLAQSHFRELLAELPATADKPDLAARYLAMRSRAQLGLNDTKSAGASIEAAVALSPALPDVQLAMARLAISRGDAAAAPAAVDAALTTDPTNLEALLIKGQLQDAAGDHAGALATLGKAVDAWPGVAGPRLGRALLLMAQGRDAEARADVRRAREMQPRNLQGAYLSGVLDVRQGEFVRAADTLGALGAGNGRYPRALYFQGRAAIGRNMAATAIDFASRYVAQNPADPDGIRLLAQAQAANGQPEAAARTLADAMARGVNDPQTLELYGKALAATGNPAASAAAFRQAIALAPEDPALTVGLALAEIQLGATAQAVAKLETEDKATPDQTDVLGPLAIAQVAAGDPDKAAATLDRLRSKTGPTEAVGILTGMLAMARLDPNQAIKAFEATAKSFPNSVVAPINLAKALAASGRRADARTVLAAVLAKQPANPDALTGFVQLAIDDQRFSLAMKALEAARRAAPAQDGLTAMLADVQLRAGDTASAIATIRSARVLGRFQPVLLNVMGRAQEAADDPVGAAQTYRDLLADGADASATQALAALLTRRKETAEARAVLDQAIRQTPGEASLLTQRVRLEADASGAEAAVVKARSLAADPAQMPAAAVLAGDALLRAGRLGEAAEQFRQQVQANPSNELRLRLAEAQFAAGNELAAIGALREMEGTPGAALLLSRVDIRAKRWPEAARRIEFVLRTRPDDAALLNNLAWAYLMSGDPRARATAQRAFLIAPNPDNADTFGWVLVQNGAPEEAVKILRHAQQQRPTDPGIGYHLAVALSRTGQGGDAHRLLNDILGTSMSFDERASAMALARSL